MQYKMTNFSIRKIIEYKLKIMENMYIYTLIKKKKQNFKTITLLLAKSI